MKFQKVQVRTTLSQGHGGRQDSVFPSEHLVERKFPQVDSLGGKEQHLMVMALHRVRGFAMGHIQTFFLLLISSSFVTPIAEFSLDFMKSTLRCSTTIQLLPLTPLQHKVYYKSAAGITSSNIDTQKSQGWKVAAVQQIHS